MERRNFAQILEAANIDIKREYDRLYSSFYLQKIQDMYENCYSLKEQKHWKVIYSFLIFLSASRLDSNWSANKSITDFFASIFPCNA